MGLKRDVAATGETRAAILAGGQSSRMGVNKALLRFGEGGATLIEVVRDRLLSAGFERPLVVTNSPEDYEFLGLETVRDSIPGAGPLAGILAGFEHSGCERLLVVACDMPLLNPALLKYMASLPGDYEAVVPRWTSDTGKVRIEPLHALYSRGCIGLIRKRLAAGDYRTHALLEGISVRYLEDAEIRRFDPQLDSFRNVNTQEDWENIRSSQGK